MRTLKHLFEKNQTWADSVKQRDPEFFLKLSQQQFPEYLWIGCSDSRVPANEIVGLEPGEMFVHRNVANLVVHSDLNCLSAMQFAVEILKVKHIIVCGHYGCSGVRAAYQRARIGLADNWLRHVQDVRDKHSEHIAKISSEDQACARLCELNVIEQVVNVCQTSIVQEAWEADQNLSIHGWVYGLKDGLLHDLKVTANTINEMPDVSRTIAGL